MKIGTHSGTFHTDDVFAIASLLLLNPEAEIVRTRDHAILDECDFVVDVGGSYDPNAFRFDHHQEGGAGTRENGIKYSAFGLIWARFGAYICMSTEIARMLDKSLVCAVDAQDNGQELLARDGALNFKGVRPFDISLVINGFNPTWEEDPNEHDARFLQAVEFARGFLRREIAQKRAMIAAREPVRAAVKNATDKRVVVLERFLPWKMVVVNESKALYVIYPGPEGRWRVECVVTAMGSFEKRKALPAAWAGKKDAEFAAITGVADAKFCHNERFVCGAETREGALALARMALEA